MQANTLLVLTDSGLYCPAGDFYIDPWRPVSRAIITHAHSDHLTWGCRRYLVSKEGEWVTSARVGHDVIETLPFGETKYVNGVKVSFHPAGHILGSAQVRVEHRGDVWVVTGDYKLEHDRASTPFELLRCNTFVTESTFAMPIYRWDPQGQIFAQINEWWRANQKAGKASVIYGYALGKAQRLIMGVDASIGPIYTHGAVERVNRDYRRSGVRIPATIYAGSVEKADWNKGLIVAPPSARATPWLRRFGTISTAFVSGWMRIRGARRQRSVDRGFAMSDHVDWDALMQVIPGTGAERVWVTHGYTAILTRWLQEHGLEAQIVPTRYEGERDEAADSLSESDELE